METKNTHHLSLVIVCILLLIGVLIAYVFFVHQEGLRNFVHQPIHPVVGVSLIHPVVDKHNNVELPQHEEGDVNNMCGTFPCYTPLEFLELYNHFERSGTLSFLTKYIYNIPEVDSYIKAKAEARGYQQRGFADETELISFEGTKTRPEVKNAYINMRNEMLEEGIRLHFVSAYRSSTHQRRIFTNKINIANPRDILTGAHDAKIDEILIVSSIPGYSKHHSGYAVDFGCGNDYLVYSFNETECYAWLSENNFENAKRFGFIPSYPEGVESQGPNPEPWEYVWVGSDYIKKAAQLKAA